MRTDINTAIEQAAVAADQEDEQAGALLATAQSFAVTSAEQYEESGFLLRQIKARQGHLNTLRLSITKPIDEAKNRVMEMFMPARERLMNAELAIKRAMLVFDQTQRREREEAEQNARRAEAKLREAAEKERQRLQALADAQRDKGQEKRAAATEERVEQVVTPSVVLPPAAPAPKVEGIARRTTWRAEVTDLMALVKAVANDGEYLGVLEPNMSVLHAYARELKDKFDIPGVRAVSEDIIAARG